MVTYKDNFRYRFDPTRRRWVKNEVVDEHQSDRIIGSVVDDDHVVGQGVMVCPNASFSPQATLTLHGDNSCEGMHVKGNATLSDVHVASLIVEDDSSLSNVHGNASVIASGATMDNIEVDAPLSLHIESQSILEGTSVVSSGSDDDTRSGLFIGEHMHVKDNSLTLHPGGTVSLHSHEGLGRLRDYDKATFHSNVIEVCKFGEFKANGSPSVSNCTITIEDGAMLEIEGVAMDGVECVVPEGMQVRVRSWDKEFVGHITQIDCSGDVVIVTTSSGGEHEVDFS